MKSLKSHFRLLKIHIENILQERRFPNNTSNICIFISSICSRTDKVYRSKNTVALDQNIGTGTLRNKVQQQHAQKCEQVSRSRVMGDFLLLYFSILFPKLLKWHIIFVKKKSTITVYINFYLNIYLHLLSISILHKGLRNVYLSTSPIITTHCSYQGWPELQRAME